MNIPRPPQNTNNEELYRSLNDMINFITYMHDNGAKMKDITQAQFDAIDLNNFENYGTLIANSNDGKIYALEKDGSTITKKRITT